MKRWTIMVLAVFSLSAHAAPFGPPERVQILGYGGDAMEPFISRDGRFLFFNNRNDPGQYTDLFYALNLDGVHFQFLGRVRGANQFGALDGVASMDAAGRFYFTSTRSYTNTLQTIYEGTFNRGRVSGAQLVAGDFAHLQSGWVTMDVEVSPDGNTLYFSDAFFSGGSVPQSSDLGVAQRAANGAFLKRADSGALLQNINTTDLEYAPSSSADGLELFFSRYRFSDQVMQILRATRTDPALPFGAPEILFQSQSIIEAPSLSGDGKSLYFHVLDGKRYRIYRAVRP